MSEEMEKGSDPGPTSDCQCEQIEMEAATDRPIVIYCHKDSQATININTVHNHCPEWLNLDAVLQIIREARGENLK